MELKFQRAEKNDLKSIISLFVEDELGKTRESSSENDFKRYLNAFKLIEQDPNQHLIVIKTLNNFVIGTCHLTVMPTLLYKGSSRLNIEAVHVKDGFRSQGVGKWMFQKIVEFAKSKNIKILQLTTNKKRNRAKVFYERLGFTASHEGMKFHLAE